MTKWRLDIDEAAIYCGDKRVASLDTDCSNDGWRDALTVGAEIVAAMNGADRVGFEARMRAAGHSQTALTRTKDGGYLSPTVQSEWRSELDVASYRRDHAAAARRRAALEEAAKACDDCDLFEYDDPGGYFARLIRALADPANPPKP